MKYEYKRVTLCKKGYYLKDENIKGLDSYFEDGWEFVDTIQQAGREYSPIHAILRKQVVDEETLLP